MADGSGENNLTKFLKSRDEFDLYQSERFESYTRNLASNYKKKSKEFWNYINSKRKQNQLPCKIYDGTDVVVNDQQKADMFAKFFASVYRAHNPNHNLQTFINDRNDHGCFNIVISSTIVHGVHTFNVFK